MKKEKRSILSKVDSPKDLKALSEAELPELAKDIRSKILETISASGGHLGASLGTVELTIALHRCFDTPTDRIVWDTGHQAYPHKLLTGRRDTFDTLRKYGGLSGFLSRNESEYDTFGAGHAGTSISAALGMVEARDQLGKDHHVIAVIGDGSMTAGMAYEALNHAGELKRNLIVVLNDNEMSISKNVGAFSAYLNRILSGRLYTKVKSEAGTLLKTIPKIGHPMLKVARRAEESVKGMIVPGLLFEELGFRYYGPFDGHRIDHLLATFENVKQLSGPILIHVVTQKGKGYAPAEADPAAYHGTPSFDLSTGKSKKTGGKKAPSYTSVFSDALIALAKEDPRIVAITAAMPAGTGLNHFYDVYPNRFYDVGISEQHAVTMAAGMAADGLKPVIAIYSTFLQRGFDQIVHDVCLQNLPVVFCLDRAGLVGEDGATHTGAYDIAYLKGIPNLILMSPKDENELRHMLYTALKQNGPVAIRYPRGAGVGVPLEDSFKALEIGQAEILMGEAEKTWHVALVALGNMLAPAQAAALMLREKGYSVGLVNARFSKPLDESLLSSVAMRCTKIVTLEEHALSGGFGESVLSHLESARNAGKILPVSVCRIGIPDLFVEHGSQAQIRQDLGLDADGIVQTVMGFISDEANQPCPPAESEVATSPPVEAV